MVYDRKRAGLTLIEILLVVVIIGILAGMIVPNVAGRTREARYAAAQVDIESNLAMALDMYEMDNGRYPTSDQGLAALTKEPEGSPIPQNWNGPYIKKKKNLKDPWGEPYVYFSPGVHNTEDYDLSSYGPDGVASDDDIVNWETDQDNE